MSHHGPYTSADQGTVKLWRVTSSRSNYEHKEHEMATPNIKVISGTAETVPPTITIHIGSRGANVTLVREPKTLEEAQEFMAHAWRVHRHGEETGETLPELRTR